jgi:hypothetical protein
MRIRGRWIVTAAAAGMFLFGGVERLLAATAPVIYSSTMGKDTATDRTVLTLLGKNLTKFSGFTLMDSLAAPVPGAIDIRLKSKTTLVLELPAGMPGGEYDLTFAVGSGAGPALHLKIDSGALFQGTLGAGTIPATGPGVRLMWYPKKAAFRAGEPTATEWDDMNVGDHSVAVGYGTTSGGAFSTAMGIYSNASGDLSTAMGASTIASGVGSIAMGQTTTASGAYSTTMGVFTTAQAYGSVALGQNNLVAGSAIGWVVTDPVLVVGNGSSQLAPSNAFTLLKNGNLTIAGTLTQNSDERLKKEVTPLAGVLRKIDAIRGVSYRLKDETRGPAGVQIGLLAQEVREVFPELVHEDTQGTLSVAYGNFSAVLLEAVKEQQAAMEKQQAALDAKDGEVAALRKELGEARAAMEKRLERLEALAAGGTATANGR